VLRLLALMSFVAAVAVAGLLLVRRRRRQRRAAGNVQFSNLDDDGDNGIDAGNDDVGVGAVAGGGRLAADPDMELEMGAMGGSGVAGRSTGGFEPLDTP
jgi:hypothetical protein